MIKTLALALLTLASPLFAGDPDANFQFQPVGKFERKASRLASKDSDFAALTADEKELLIKAIAARLEKIDAENRRGGQYKEKVDGANLHIFITAADLEALKAKYPYIKTAETQGRVIRETQTQDPSTTKTVDQPPQLTVETVPSPDFHSLFKDDEYVLDDKSCEAGQLAAIVDDAVAAAGKDGKIQAITIESSASTLRNKIVDKDTGQPMTFKKLSQLRAEQARSFVLARLAAKGYAFPENGVVINAGGVNGDGTTGPADPYGNGGKGDGGAPLKDVKDYDQFKYVRVSMAVAKVSEETPAPKLAEVPGQEHSEVIAFDLDTESRCKFLRCIQFPTIHIARHVSRKHWGSTDCWKP